MTSDSSGGVATNDQGVQTRDYISFINAEKYFFSLNCSLSLCVTSSHLCSGNCRLDVGGEMAGV